MVKEKKHITLLRFLFLLIFVTHLFSVTLFSHTHLVHGVYIVHSHINGGEHNHSQQSFETIFFLSKTPVTDEFKSSVMAGLELSLIRILQAPAITDLIPVIAGVTPSLRAPPVLF